MKATNRQPALLRQAGRTAKLELYASLYFGNKFSYCASSPKRNTNLQTVIRHPGDFQIESRNY